MKSQNALLRIVKLDAVDHYTQKRIVTWWANAASAESLISQIDFSVWAFNEIKTGQIYTSDN